MALEIRPSARKRGISDERIEHVVRTCPMPIEHPNKTGQVILLGPDSNGVPLEVVAFEDDDGNLDVIHAMRLRPSYREAFEEVMNQWPAE